MAEQAACAASNNGCIGKNWLLHPKTIFWLAI
jgi:hypothetical protein